MKKLFYLAAVVILGLSSCKKNDTTIDDEPTKETFVWEGETFDVAETRKKLSLILATDEDQFIFVPDSLAFQWKRPTSDNEFFLYVKDFIRAVKNLEI